MGRLATNYAKVACMARFINTLDNSIKIFNMWDVKAFGSNRVGIEIFVVLNGRYVDGDMEEEESGEVLVEEESITMTCAVGGVEAR